MSEEKPKLVLAVADVLCSQHGEPFRAAWPKGYATASMGLLDAFVALPQVAERLGQAEAGGAAAALDAAISEYKPLCCSVPKKTLRRIYKLAGIGKLGRCEICGELAQGTPYRVMLSEEEAGVYDHLCFDCVISPPHTAGPPV